MVLFCSALTTSPSYAEYFGSPTGRTAQFSVQTPLALEIAYSNGEFVSSDYQQIGVRLSYQFSPKILVFGDIGQSELSSESETSFGLGAYYSLNQSILGSDDSAVKVSLHQVDFAVVPGRTITSFGGIETGCRLEFIPNILGDGLPDLDCTPQVTTSGANTYTTAASGGAIRNIAVELLISGAIGDSILGGGAHWYANGGIQMFNGAMDDTVLGIGAGIVLPIAKSEVYGGFDYADDAYVGIGFRYFIE